MYKEFSGIIRSDSDTENEMKTYNEGDKIVLQQGERHRLIGLEDFCVVAEIWQHADANHPFDERNTKRAQYNFCR
jgi:mannose-6-phosphate isomerase